jgi:hypothetical protein
MLIQKQKLDVSQIKCWIAFKLQYAVLHQISNCMKKKEWKKEKLVSVSNAEQ